ncbi:MAG: hypothetical protein R3E86_13865 [Pseudomonadales bacterium]
MPEIVFLLGDVTLARNDNHQRLPAAFAEAGWSVTSSSHEQLRLSAGTVCIGTRAAQSYDLVWPLGFGRMRTFFDRMQLLHRLDQRRLVVPADAFIYLHAKYAWCELMPETHASSDYEVLRAVLDRGGDWVAKPTAGSYGRDVERIRADDRGETVLRRLTGGDEPCYCILQRYVPEIERGEKRVLVAGGQLIGSYLRLPGADFRTNLAIGGEPRPTRLSAAERELAERVAAELAALRIGFAAVDMAYPYLMEVNLANPGGLATLESLYGVDPTPRAVAAICAALESVRSL